MVSPPSMTREMLKGLDRFLTENQGWSAQIRAEQALAAGNVRRLREKVDGFTVFKVLSTLMPHPDSNLTAE